MITRFSSRQQQLGHSYISDRLKNAKSYDRIAGFFRSSMLEIAGEEIESMDGIVRVVCNSDLDERDVATAKSAQLAMRKSWCSGEPENLPTASAPRFKKLYKLLSSKKLQIKVLPDKTFGLIHGKAGVITLANGSKTSFLGSVNESITAWKINYELLWEDDSSESVEWVQNEFDTLWNHPSATWLSDFVIEDIGRIAERKEIDYEEWKKEEDPASSIVETPVYRKEYGLWSHQKYFVDLAFKAHKDGGARFVLADQVGLGKTVQLALAAMLMALHGKKPVIAIVPKTLTLQWQQELVDLLAMPSAIWNGKQWIDEQGIEYPAIGPEGIRKCPRRFGIVSQGLVIHGSESTELLKYMDFECIIVDEGHKARRRNFGRDKWRDNPESNKLMKYLLEISQRTKSMMIGTATPVQLDPIEAWDLLNILSQGNDIVFGDNWSKWRKADKSLPIVLGEEALPTHFNTAWEWMRNPFPPKNEARAFDSVRRSLRLSSTDNVVLFETLDRMRKPDVDLLKRERRTFGNDHNPFIRHIVRRTREYLENTVDPETGEPYLQPVRVRLHGEDSGDALILPTYLEDAYHHAEEFCRLLQTRVKSAGFLKTLLLRRMGSSIIAGRNTAQKMLTEWGNNETMESILGEEDDDNIDNSSMKDITPQERIELELTVAALNDNMSADPKYKVVVEYLIQKKWLELGCIIFSQYYDSAYWLAEELSKNELKREAIGIYAGSTRSGIMENGYFVKKERDTLKQMVRSGELRLLIGTDAASEGLNLQRLGTLINLDLPWNPTKLEQRKGRIQRIGQSRENVDVLNLRYRGSVEDRVHELLSSRLASIRDMFGQIPDVLEDVWVDVAKGELAEAERHINEVQNIKHPFDERYSKVKDIDWDRCTTVLSSSDVKDLMMKKW
jgi:superfamily II DNA or RNA helicase